MFLEYKGYVLTLMMFSVLLVSLTGCMAATKNDSRVKQDLQMRIISLQSDLDRTDTQIEDLKYELEQKKDNYDLARRRNYDADYYQGRSKTGKPTNKEIQNALKTAGYYMGSIDGAMGPKTKSAIVEFQKSNGLKADGVVGSKTWAKLRRYL